MGTIQLKFKSLVKHISFLKSDLEYHRAEHKKRRDIFYSELDKFMSSENFELSDEKLQKNMIDVYKRERAVEMPNLKKQSSRLFKKIARLTHPDVNKDLENHELFRKAKEAEEENDWFTIYEISADLGIGVDEIGQEHLDWLEQEILKIQKTIKTIKDTFEWIYSNEGANKEQILTTYCMITCKDVKK